MFRECVENRTFNQLKDTWFNATIGERKFLGMLAFMSLYMNVCVHMNANLYACMMSVSNVF